MTIDKCIRIWLIVNLRVKSPHPLDLPLDQHNVKCKTVNEKKKVLNYKGSIH